MNVRKSDIKDVREVLRVINRSNAEAFKKIIPPVYFREPVFTYDEFLKKIKEMTFYSYKLKGEIIGVAALQVESGSLGNVRFVYVLPQHQRKGVGTSLVTCIEAEARKLKLETLRVPYVDINAYRAINFYKKLGYTVVDKHKNPWGYDLFFEKVL